MVKREPTARTAIIWRFYITDVPIYNLRNTSTTTLDAIYHHNAVRAAGLLDQTDTQTAHFPPAWPAPVSACNRQNRPSIRPLITISGQCSGLQRQTPQRYIAKVWEREVRGGVLTVGQVCGCMQAKGAKSGRKTSLLARLARARLDQPAVIRLLGT